MPSRTRPASRRVAAPLRVASVRCVLALLALVPPRASSAQAASPTLSELTSTPDATAELFLRSVRAIRWGAAAQFIAPETLDRFRTTVTMIADADSSGDVRAYLVGLDSAATAAIDPADLFDRSIGRMIDDMPGLMHSIYDREDEVLGHVPEGDRDAHVVYRTTARISGAVPEVKVMQMQRGPGGWRVLWSDELEVLEAALRGVPRGR